MKVIIKGLPKEAKQQRITTTPRVEDTRRRNNITGAQ